MGKVYEGIDDRLAAFMAAQAVFFVATAPSGAEGRVNVSPKGYADTFAVLGPRRVAYLDLTGSGVETVAHLRDNGRVTLMFCAFSGPPKILRLYGQGRVVTPGDPEFAGLAARFGEHVGTRSVVVVDVEHIQDACGYAVPFMEVTGERTLLDESHARKGPERLDEYRATRNATSLDGLPGLPDGDGARPATR